jgi:hypothetical protein
MQDRENEMLHQQPMQQGIQRRTSGTDVYQQRNIELRHNRLVSPVRLLKENTRRSGWKRVLLMGVRP